MKLLAETIGVDKILFGSDWPHGEGLADPMTFTADIPQFPEFSAEDTRKVMRDNALDLLGVERSGQPSHGGMDHRRRLDAIADVIPDRTDDGLRRTPEHLWRHRPQPHPSAGELPGRQGIRRTPPSATGWRTGSAARIASR